MVVAGVRHELCDGTPCVCDHDLLPEPNASQKVREAVAGVRGVVLGQWLAWRGVATWRGVASPPEKRLQHGTYRAGSGVARKWQKCVCLSELVS